MSLDELSRVGWPAVSEVDVDGWVARFSGGVTQRANSVLPLSAPDDVGAALDRVEALYASHGLPPVFQLGSSAQPAGLDEVLAERGYEYGSPTSIQVADVGGEPVEGVEIESTPSEDWLNLWWAVDGRGDEHALAVAVRILTGGPALYASIRDGQGIAAAGRLALVGEWGGLYCMAVRPDARRRGLGQAILAGLLHAAQHGHGVTRCWLQVRAENADARRLYERAGFTEVDRYHYRTRRSDGGQEPVQDVHAEP